MKKFLIGTAAGALMLGAMIVPAFAAGPICTVPGSYSTIQDAVNDSGCITINVAAGTYLESVNINHGLILNGPNVGNSGNGLRVGEATVQSVNITESNVTVDGFSFTNAGSQMNINGTTKLSGVKVQNNIFSGYSSVGFPTYNAGNLLITRNLFKIPLANTESIQIKADGSTSGGCNGTVVSDNVFTAASNNGGAEINFSCTGSNSTGVTVSGNTSTGLTGGTSFTAFSGVIGDITVKDNTVTQDGANGGSAVYFFGDVSGTTGITGNTINNTGASAVSIHGNGDGGTASAINTGTFTITQNVLSGNVRGVYISSKALGTSAKVIASRNNLSGDTTYGVDNEFASIVADGTCNWWGAANGPGPVGSGTGANVSSNINYKPWLVSSNLNGLCIGGNVVTKKDQCKDNGWKNYVDDNNKPFKNQGQCEEYVESHKVKPGKVDGDIRMGSPKQKMDFNLTEGSSSNQGQVEYQNFEYPGGLHYKAKALCVYVNKTTKESRFMFQIPNGFPGLSGLYIVSYVKDGGAPGKIHDLYGHTSTSSLSTAQSWCNTGSGFVPSMYPITDGNVVVH
jgi:hypothetical protein